jgi:hypothetical protein
MGRGKMKQCAKCGKEFTPYKEKWGKYCSRKCYKRSNIITHKRSTGLNEFRIQMGLAPLEPGMIDCRRCGKKFYSWDKTRNKTCAYCINREEN